MMKDDKYNIELSASDILKLCDLDNVKIIPVCYVLNFPNPNEIVYLENDEVQVCHKDDIFSEIETIDEVLLPVCVYKNQSEMPYPLKVVQELYLNNVLNNLLRWLGNKSISDVVNISPSFTDKTYNENAVASLYFITQPVEMTYAELKKIHDKFIKDNNMSFSYSSANGTHIHLHKQDRINIYDIAKYTNYIKLKGFTDNFVQIDLELHKKSFSAFCANKEISRFIKYFFGEEVWSQR